MSIKLFRMTESNDRITYWFWCPGCNHLHVLDSRWTVNSYDPPDVTGSYLQYEYVPEDPVKFQSIPRCHLFIRNGQLQYLSDCTHELVNMTIEMPDLPE